MTILIGIENELAIVSALRDVVGQTDHDSARDSRHKNGVAWEGIYSQESGKEVSVPV